jgi:hypothetical protein
VTEFENLYRELKPDVEQVANPLFQFAEQQVRKRGAFLPVGACLSRSGEVSLLAASDGHDVVSGVEILPLLHEGLRATVAQSTIAAVAVCEWVRVAPEGASMTDAIKVLVEHERGLTVAFYVPCRRRTFGGWGFEAVLATPAEAEVRPWAQQAPA